MIVGVLPYAWMVRRSWQPLPISFNGPLETIQEILFFVGRKGYAGVDHSVSAGWLDRVRFFEFFGGELLRQFAVVGTLLAVAGFVVQWRILGQRVAAFLSVAFLMPSAVLLLLLGFDYDSFRAHVFHVYPLPAYAVCALWTGLGFAWAVPGPVIYSVCALTAIWYANRAVSAAGTLARRRAAACRPAPADRPIPLPANRRR